jgi:hypothetical protein
VYVPAGVEAETSGAARHPTAPAPAAAPRRRNALAAALAVGRATVDVVPDLEGARCRGADSDLFFGPPGAESRTERLRREATAKAMCRDCPALQPCRAYALTHAELYGVWGGLGEQERRTQLMRLGRLPAP